MESIDNDESDHIDDAYYDDDDNHEDENVHLALPLPPASPGFPPRISMLATACNSILFN